MHTWFTWEYFAPIKYLNEMGPIYLDKVWSRRVWSLMTIWIANFELQAPSQFTSILYFLVLVYFIFLEKLCKFLLYFL